MVKFSLYVLQFACHYQNYFWTSIFSLICNRQRQADQFRFLSWFDSCNYLVATKLLQIYIRQQTSSKDSDIYQKMCIFYAKTCGENAYRKQGDDT